MTCVWDSLAAGLRQRFPQQAASAASLLAHLKAHNTQPVTVLWQGRPLSDNQLEENVEAVNAMTVCASGYLCSTCDALIIACCHTFQVNIRHTYNQITLEYTVPNAALQLHISSDQAHMNLLSSK